MLSWLRPLWRLEVLALLALALLFLAGKWTLVFLAIALLLAVDARASSLPPLAEGGFISHDNNFNIVRILLAWGVLFQHSYPFSGTPTVSWFDRNIGINLGVYAVNLFFFVSGLLVSQSLARRGSLRDFLRARVARIVPALCLVVGISVFALGPWFTQLSLPQYFSDESTWEYLYRNIFLIHTEYLLPGVFQDNPHSPSINGSLWSLRYEMKMYLLLALLGFLGVLAQGRRFALFSACYLGWYAFVMVNPDAREVDGDLIRTSLYFYLGCLSSVMYRHLPIRLAVVVLLGLLAGVLWNTALHQLSLALALCFALLWVATVPGGWLRKYNKVGDYSYGVYLFGCPVQQSLVALFPAIGFWGMLGGATVVSLLFALLSWHWVERPCLEWVKSRHRRAAARDAVVAL